MMQADKCVLDPSVDSKLKALVAKAQEALTMQEASWISIYRESKCGVRCSGQTLGDCPEHTTASGKCPESALQLGREIRKAEEDDKRVRKELL